MAYTAVAVINAVGEILDDPHQDVWDSDLICRKVTEAQNLIVSLRPDANAVTETHALTLTAKQVIPTGGFKVLDIVMNTGGSPIQKIERDRLTRLVPGWTTETGTEIEFFMLDPENPTVFWVYPTLSGSGNVEIVYSKPPDAFTAASTTLGIPDVYISQIYDWVLYRCYGMETSGQSDVKANHHLSNFVSTMGLKRDNDILLRQIQEVDK